MNNFKNITMAIVAAATLTSVNAGPKWEATKDAMSRQKWTAVTALVAAAVGALNNTVVAKMAKKAKTRNNAKKANFLNNVRKGVNALVVGALAGAAYGAAAIEANQSLKGAEQLADDANAPAHVVSALELGEDAKVADAKAALMGRFVAARDAKALADAKASALGNDFDGQEPAGYVAAGDARQAAEQAARDAYVAYDNYVAAMRANFDAEVNSHFVDQNGFMRFVRNYAPLFNGQADIPAAPEAPEAVA